jgi:drug/metabolite transporter (DMT)-like permease
MYAKSNVTPALTVTPSLANDGGQQRRALGLCGLGVLGFSLTVPATRIASGQIDAFILGPGRGVLAALLAILILRARAESLPTRHQLLRLAAVGMGIVVGFPLLTSLALARVSAHHAVVLIGLTPLLTSLLATLRNGERPSRAFWLFALLGGAAVVLFGISAHGLALQSADLLLLLAALVVAMGYAEGGKLAAELDGVRVICWALVLSLPLGLASVLYALAYRPLPMPDRAAVAGFLYISLVSSLLAFCAWYRGLALGGVARGSQVQLLQPVLSLFWCALLLHEPLSAPTLLAGAAVLASAAGSRWTRA